MGAVEAEVEGQPQNEECHSGVGLCENVEEIKSRRRNRYTGEIYGNCC